MLVARLDPGAAAGQTRRAMADVPRGRPATLGAMATPDVRTTPWPDRPASRTGDVALVLGGSDDSFTGLLLELMCKADPGHRARLAAAFPREDLALRVWHEMPAPTLASLAAALAAALADPDPDPGAMTADQLARLAFVRDAWGAYMDSPLPDPDPDGVIRVQLAAGLTLSIPLGD